MGKLSKVYTFLLFLPQIAILGILLVGIIAGIIQSFGIIPALNLESFTFLYYQEVLSDPQLISTLVFTLRISLISASLSVLLGLVIIYLIIRLYLMRRALINLVQIPIIIPYTIVALFIIILFARTGIIARIAYYLGLEDAPKILSQFLFNPNGLGIILGYLWKGVPFIIFYCYEIIQTIHQSFGEASLSLGASPIKSFIFVTLPMCKQTLISGFLILFMYAFGAYELPKLLGPTLPKHIAEYAYIEFSHPDLLNRPYAMAINGLILLVSLIAATLMFLLTRRKEK